MDVVLLPVLGDEATCELVDARVNDLEQLMTSAE